MRHYSPVEFYGNTIVNNKCYSYLNKQREGKKDKDFLSVKILNLQELNESKLILFRNSLGISLNLKTKKLHST